MIASRYLILLVALPQIALACAVLSLVPLEKHSGYEHLCIGALIGTMFSQTTLAAAWTALGPGPLLLRLPLSILWVAVMLVCLGLGMTFRREPEEALVSIMAMSLAIQWFFSQIPLWTLVVFFRLRLRPVSELVPDGDGPRRQFGIGQLMVFTGLIGVLLGIGRLVIGSRWFRLNIDDEMPIFLFLVGSAIVVTLPLVFAAFLSRHSVIAMLGALVFIMLVSVAEMPLLDATVGSRGGPDLMHIVYINLFSTAWVLAMTAAVRLSGYRFGAAGESPFAAEKVADSKIAR